MRPLHPCIAALVLWLASLGVAAQPAAAPEPAKAPPKPGEPAKPQKPAAAKKAEAKKTDAKKDTPRKKPDAKQPEAKPRQEPKVYTTGPKEIRDKDGNVIPTSPDAYNVDSALPPKPRK